MIFISHASEDKELAGKLAGTLRGAGLEVWTEEDQIFPGDNWASEIGSALEKADLFLVLVTPHAAESKWVTREIQYALTRKERARVIPVLVGDSTVENLPWVLRHMKGVHVGDIENWDQVVHEVQAVAH